MFRQREVRALLTSHGQPITYHTYLDGDYDPATASVVSVPNDPINVIGYFYSYSLEEMASSAIEKGDRKLLLSTIDTSGNTIPEPQTDDTFSGVGDSVSVKTVEKIYSKDLVMAYILGVGE